MEGMTIILNMVGGIVKFHEMNEMYPFLSETRVKNLCIFLFIGFSLFKFCLIICSGFLVLLVFRDQVIHVGFSLSELHLVHTLTCIPMQESFTLEQFPYGCGITNKCRCHFDSTRRDVTDSSLNIVRNPFNKERGILVLNVIHLFINLLH